MGQTSIEWTSYRKSDGTIVPGYTLSPVIGCAKKSPGCKFCYAEHDTPARVARSQGLELWGVDAARKPASESYWKQPHAWNRAAQRDGAPRLVFVASQSDWLEDRIEWAMPRAQLLMTILQTPNLIWLLLSKEPWNFKKLVLDAARYWNKYDKMAERLIAEWTLSGSVEDIERRVFPNVRLGVSVENQEWADKRREAFAALPGSKFVSYEPAIGPVDWTGWEFVDQIISGGESGKDKGIRPSHPDWHRATRDWCKANGKAYFFKQWGEWRPSVQEELDGDISVPLPEYDNSEDVFGDGEFMWRVGKRNAGNVLDGHQHLEIPGINFQHRRQHESDQPRCTSLRTP